MLLTLAVLWAANPHASWLARLAPIGLLLAMLAPMGLIGFAIMFAFQTVIVLGVLATARAAHRWSTTRQPQERGEHPETHANAGLVRWLPQFSLGQLFISLLVGAIILALVTNAPDEEEIVDLSTLAAWVQLGLLGLTLAIATLFAWMLVVMGRWRTVAIAIVSLFIAALVGEQSGLAASLGGRFDITDRWLLAAVWIVSLSLILSICLWLLARAGWNWWSRPTAARPPSKLARFVVVLVSLTLTLPTISLAWAMIPPAPLAEPALPNPNGYDMLAKTERQLSWNAVTVQDPLQATVQDAANFVRANQDLLTDLSTALDLRSQVPLDWTPNQSPSSPTAIFHDVYYAWHLAAKAALAADDDDRAVECYLSILRASNICANGGAAADELIANTLAAEGAAGLAGMLSRLSDEQLAKLQRGAQQCLTAREAIEPIIDRTERLELINGGWSGRLSAWFVKHRLSPGFDTAVELPNHRAARDARLNLLIVECALHRYHLKHGDYPEKLSRLAPGFIEKLPRDPFADGPFQYRRTDAGYLLYSINADRVDNGGVQAEYRGLYEGDLLLRSSKT